MARPRGSKNKAKVIDGIDYAAQIAEKNTAAKSLAEEIAALGTNIAALNAERKAKEAELKKLNKDITKLEKKKAEADEKIAAELNRKKAEDIVANALANGMTAEEIAELLK
jgi:septal ring factor EnvC (AmiA/AmiB activator)